MSDLTTVNERERAEVLELIGLASAQIEAWTVERDRLVRKARALGGLAVRGEAGAGRRVKRERTLSIVE
ncbi:hypothetical protein F0L68_15705 [Solihabitans fulvus]|uniref:Uncharacterized protein n=1 Tax=Solihabitans fulvus TaxID=1892852 RepID=A0A5B2XEB9_9PSEU|nr:hypothetical protein [Solihabitans fulvus]KAA2261693.1 hypothetical protein F0L68_15705 [Solihabitans fulvus]